MMSIASRPAMMPPFDAHCIPLETSASVAYTLGAIWVTRAKPRSNNTGAGRGSFCAAAVAPARAVQKNCRRLTLFIGAPRSGKCCAVRPREGMHIQMDRDQRKHGLRLL